MKKATNETARAGKPQDVGKTAPSPEKKTDRRTLAQRDADLTTVLEDDLKLPEETRARVKVIVNRLRAFEAEARGKRRMTAVQRSNFLRGDVSQGALNLASFLGQIPSEDYWPLFICLCELASSAESYISLADLSTEQIVGLVAQETELSAVADEEMAAKVRVAAENVGPLHDAYVSYANDLDVAAKKKRSFAALTVPGASEAAHAWNKAHPPAAPNPLVPPLANWAEVMRPMLNTLASAASLRAAALKSEPQRGRASSLPRYVGELSLLEQAVEKHPEFAARSGLKFKELVGAVFNAAGVQQDLGVAIKALGRAAQAAAPQSRRSVPGKKGA